MFPVHTIQEANVLYSSDKVYLQRYQSLIAKFQKEYNGKPDFIARAPGRVNIIGEHIDYEGYGVFPAAIQKDCLIAVKKAPFSQKLQICHIDSDAYPSFKASINPEVKQQYPNKYLTYFMAGYRAGSDQFDWKAQTQDQENNPNLSKENLKLIGMQVMISGNIPIGSGVSSSSALVVCSALACFYANYQENAEFKTVISSAPSKSALLTKFIKSCIQRQKQSGTAAGGMDQSISVLGKLDSCLYIQFTPEIKCQKVQIPKGCKLIIMNSLVESHKSNTAVHRYNKRVCECRLALFLLAKNLGIPKQTYTKWRILKDVQQHLGLELSSSSLKQCSELVDKWIVRKPYTHQDIDMIFEEELGKKQIWNLLSDIQLSSGVIESNKTFNLFQAGKHVFEQAKRVLDLIQVCRQSDSSDQQKNVQFGKLMNESHESCRTLYDCSCEQLDQLTNTALKNGALGSRLTGAGWGGCTVSLVKESNVKQFIQSMISTYYSKQSMKEKIQKQKDGITSIVFESKPCQGACIINL